ncbi:hypothetical protein Tco_0251047 [Tanacetum coccineum]
MQSTVSLTPRSFKDGDGDGIPVPVMSSNNRMLRYTTYHLLRSYDKDLIKGVQLPQTTDINLTSSSAQDAINILDDED